MSRISELRIKMQQSVNKTLDNKPTLIGTAYVGATFLAGAYHGMTDQPAQDIMTATQSMDAFAASLPPAASVGSIAGGILGLREAYHAKAGIPDTVIVSTLGIVGGGLMTSVIYSAGYGAGKTVKYLTTQ